jgi:hypothetical protein
LITSNNVNSRISSCTILKEYSQADWCLKPGRFWLQEVGVFNSCSIFRLVATLSLLDAYTSRCTLSDRQLMVLHDVFSQSLGLPLGKICSCSWWEGELMRTIYGLSFSF